MDEGNGEKTGDFIIPPPPSMDAEESNLSSLFRAIEEERRNKKGDLEKARRAGMDWGLKFWLKILLFAFVLILNGCWDYQVIRWVWYSGTLGGYFHLSDPVLIALATTSTANFLALIFIVAKHLFPSDEK